jgi:Protein of unknown function (DUF1552)
MKKLSRRLFLKGAGVTVGLPWLESMPVAHASGRFPQRLAVLFMGNGINGNHWWAKGTGANMQLGKSLGPMEPFKAKMNFISGLFNKPSTGVGIHPGQTGNILSGVPLQKGAVLRGGISMDQVLANHVGQETMQASLVLGCEQPNTGYHETNFSMAYSSHISWQSPETPVPMEVYPSLAFDSLFENRGSKRTASILDRVQEQAAALGRKASARDRLKLGEYLTSVREVEKQIERTRAGGKVATAVRTAAANPTKQMDRPKNGLPEDLRDHMRLMCDIVALAFETDKTRIASLLLCRDLSGLFYPFLDVRDAHHPASHRDLTDDYERVSRFYCGQVAYLCGRLAAMREGEGSVLDNSCILFLSNMWSGFKHDNSKLPVLTVGSLGGKLATGRVLDYLDQGDDNRKVCSLYLSLMDRMGVKLDKFGDATTRLAGV